MNFIDLFSGCGGLSLGLMQAGWEGLFGIEKTEDAFETLKYNLIDGNKHNYKWPSWLSQININIDDFITNYKNELIKLQGKVDLVAGGPPCQGYSLIGRRDPNDPRNQLFMAYVEIVNLLKPRFLLFENVQSIAYGFKSVKTKQTKELNTPYSDIISIELKKANYKVFSKVINSSDVGIPQMRKRFVLIAIRSDDPSLLKIRQDSPFDYFENFVPDFRSTKGLNRNRETTVKMAISDLTTYGKKLIACIDSNKNGFFQIDYKPPQKLNPYLGLLRKGMNGEIPNSLRLANHKEKTKNKFNKIINTCIPGRNLSLEDRKRLGIKKHAITLLDPNSLAATVTTLPDDIIHYNEPRILTVREMARLQSFPDWFSFMGRYTTGNNLRKYQCPRYTQVGNAVPPLMSEALGNTLAFLAN